MINPQASTRKKVNVRRMTIISLLSAISIMLSMIPLGYIQIGPLAITTMCIPVMIGGIIEGPMVGMVVGLIFGLTSMFRGMAGMAGVTGFVFINPLVSVLPRIFIGLVSYYSFKLSMKIIKNTYVSGLIAGGMASITNTVGVLGMIYVLYAAEYAKALGQSAGTAKALLMGIATTNGIAEALGGALVVSAVVVVLKKSKI
ncbi:ECF transporter S component [Romboutsia sp. CE17]|uniref:ECF transporter S component n=1 Tax=Romboutsia sp. CE17 TaxID=2724150 RepID=UPI001442D548|nr:ECF transporter S component [Romboutsia sp. CE17]QJA09726.1 ECF transporter S component [Romboutsia sp. CE17]